MEESTAQETESQTTFEENSTATEPPAEPSVESPLQVTPTESQPQEREQVAPSKTATAPETQEISAEPAPSQNTGGVDFEMGTFTHTRTGEKLAEAKLQNRIDKDEFKQLTALAKKHNGNYSKFSQSFLFKSPEDRDAFVQETKGNSVQVQPETSTTSESVQVNAKPLTDESADE